MSEVKAWITNCVYDTEEYDFTIKQLHPPKSRYVFIVEIESAENVTGTLNVPIDSEMYNVLFDSYRQGKFFKLSIEEGK